MDKLQLKLNNLKHSRIGIISTVIFITIVWSIMLIKPLDEMQLVLIGFLGIVSLISSIIGFCCGLIGLFQQETIKIYSLIGVIGNGVFAVVFIYFFYIGMMI